MSFIVLNEVGNWVMLSLAYIQLDLFCNQRRHPLLAIRKNADLGKFNVSCFFSLLYDSKLNTSPNKL